MNSEPDEIDFEQHMAEYWAEVWMEEESEREAYERMTPEEREQDRLFRESEAFVDPFGEAEGTDD